MVGYLLKKIIINTKMKFFSKPKGILSKAKSMDDFRKEKRDCTDSFSSLVTYLDSSESVMIEIRKGNLEKAKWLLKTTAKEQVALRRSTTLINMMNGRNSSEIVEQIRVEAYR